jgi:hypothetical protein
MLGLDLDAEARAGETQSLEAIDELVGKRLGGEGRDVDPGDGWIELGRDLELWQRPAARTRMPVQAAGQPMRQHTLGSEACGDGGAGQRRQVAEGEQAQADEQIGELRTFQDLDAERGEEAKSRSGGDDAVAPSQPRIRNRIMGTVGAAGDRTVNRGTIGGWTIGGCTVAGLTSLEGGGLALRSEGVVATPAMTGGEAGGEASVGDADLAALQGAEHPIDRGLHLGDQRLLAAVVPGGSTGWKRARARAQHLDPRSERLDRRQHRLEGSRVTIGVMRDQLELGAALLGLAPALTLTDPFRPSRRRACEHTTGIEHCHRLGGRHTCRSHRPVRTPDREDAGHRSRSPRPLHRLEKAAP